MDPRPPVDPPDPSAAELFADFLERRERGEEIELDELCDRHPEVEDELRRLHEDWFRIQFLLELRGVENSLSLRIKKRADAERLATPVSAMEAANTDEQSSATLQRLRERREPSKRYTLEGELARGGQGAIVRVWDEDLNRHLAMKVALGDGTEIDARSLTRFLAEAQVTGQLDHPGIVPVHELGLDSNGRVFFTMKLVKGRDLRTVFDLVYKGEEGWSLPRALGVFLKVCEAMAYAHDKDVIHRDLKPGNVMVGEYGEVYVMDWGLAQILGKRPARDVRIQPAPPPLSPEAFQSTGSTPPDSPLVTMDGHVVGTPAYMSPEQALGDVAHMGPHSDVYSVGAMLYQLVTKRMPYVPTDSDVNNYSIWYEVQMGPPLPCSALAPNVPEELIAIVDKAMARDYYERYPDMQELADDLRAYVEGRVVQAYETGSMAEFRKWVLRNRGLSTASVAAALLLIVGAVVSFVLKSVADDQRVFAQENELEAKSERDNVLRLSALQNLEDLRQEADRLWPVVPANIPRFEAWLERARGVEAGLHPDPEAEDVGHYARLQELRERAVPLSAEEQEARRRVHPDYAEYGFLSERLASLSAADRVRSGAAELEEVELEGDLPDDAGELRRMAERLVDPERTVFGREPEGLALVRHAIDLVENDAEYAALATTEAWALLACGLDDEARDKMSEALEIAEPGQKAELEDEAVRLEIEIAEAPSALEKDSARMVELDVAISRRSTWDFVDDDTRWWHTQLEKLVAEIESFADEDTGLMGFGVDPGFGWGIEKRLELARDLERREVDDAELWEEARAAIEESAAYGGLALAQQAGLVPLGPDPDSGLWEFAHLQTGTPPERDESGRLVLTEESGLVLVLLPGGSFAMGSQPGNQLQPNYDPVARPDEGPVHEVTLSPFFVSKFELTQGQWLRLTGENPSYWTVGDTPDYGIESQLHPVEQVDWWTGTRVLARLGLELPSEAQWEYAARGGTTGRYWTGDAPATLEGAENLGDLAALEKETLFPITMENGDWLEWNDGYPTHAPVGRFRANPFGLHDVLGNVIEFCRDTYDEKFYRRSPEEDPVNDPPKATTRIGRGNSYQGVASGARSAVRQFDSPGHASSIIGLRPVRALD